MTQLGTKKSRKGCYRCKRRRVKCDEQAPCSNCARRNEECSLLEPTPSSSNESTLDPALPANNDEWIQDLELMHHYSTSTATSALGIRAKVQILWRDYIPKQAIKHPFLMHGLLALSALHLAYLDSDSSVHYLQLSDKHQTIALKTFRNILSSEIKPDMADALFALAATISISSMARSCAAAQGRDTSKEMSMDDVAELFFLTRGVRDVIHLAHNHIRKGPMAEMFESHEYPEGTVITLPPDVIKHLTALHQYLISYGLDPEALEHCQSALRNLENIYENMIYWSSFADLETGQVWRWPTMITTGYVRLLQARNPPALIVFAHFAAATMAIRTAWFTQHWGEYAVRGVSLELDSSMQHWLEWPKRQVEERMAGLGIRVTEAPGSPAKPLIGF